MAEQCRAQPQTGRIDVNRFLAVMSDVLSDKYDLKITLTARSKDEIAGQNTKPATA